MYHVDVKKMIDERYEEGRPVMSDALYDSTFGVDATTLSSLKPTGQPLPVWMGSLDKIRNETELERWLKKQTCSSFIITPKLDGCSAIIVNDSQELLSRGNGKIGTSWTKAFPFLNATFNTLESNAHIRCEVVMKKNTFQDKYATFKNQRNMVVGQLNCKQVNPTFLRDIDIVPYELILNNNVQLVPEEQLKRLHVDENNNRLCWKRVQRKHMTIDFLSTLLNEWLESCLYFIDGLVITANIPYERNVTNNPSYAIAYKKHVIENEKITIVQKVVWNKSVWGSFIPVVHVDPIVLGGVTISKVSGHNAAYIQREKIGPGATIVCTRSGDVIPKIVNVVIPSSHVVFPEGHWVGVNIVDEHGGCRKKCLHHLLIACGVKHVGLKTVENLFQYDITDLFSLLNASTDLKCFKGKQGKKIYTSIQNLVHTRHDVATIVGASGVFNKSIGQKSMEKLVGHVDVFSETIPSLSQLEKINGFSRHTAQQIIDNYANMKQFLHQCTRHGIVFNTVNETVGKKKICLSGFRDGELSKHFDVCDALTKDVDVLVVKDVTKETAKTKIATMWNIPIMSRENLKTMKEKHG